MTSRCSLLFGLLAFSFFSISGSLSGDPDAAGNRRSSDFYVAAVVEYEADKDTAGLTQAQVLWQNVEAYEMIISEAGKKKADVIVFPEYGLTSLAFSRPLFQRIADVGHNPCLQPKDMSSDEAIQHLSCAARSAQIYVVIDIAEQVVGNDTAGGTGRNFYYNTALVFGRDGTIIAKYHKTNLFAEPGLDAPPVPQLVSFSTDFGVTFGVFICFDMLFKEPVRELVESGIGHFVYPTAWIDELPYLTAIQAQTYWSSSANAVLLASGYHQPQFGKLGSGIFVRGEPLNYTFNPASSTRIVYAQVPKSGPMKSNTTEAKAQQCSSSSHMSSSQHYQSRSSYEEDHHWFYRENLTNYTSTSLELTSAEQQVSACDNGFCCSLNYSFTDPITTSSSSTWEKVNHKLIVFNQARKFSSPSVVRTMHVQVCSVVRCLSDTIESCAEHSAQLTSARFKKFELAGGPFQGVFHQHTLPGFTTLDVNFEIIPGDMFDISRSNISSSDDDDEEEDDDGGGTMMMMMSVKSDERIRSVDIQTLAMYHRVY